MNTRAEYKKVGSSTGPGIYIRKKERKANETKGRMSEDEEKMRKIQ